MIDGAVIETLLTIGRSLHQTGIYPAVLLDKLRAVDSINRLLPAEWDVVSDSLDDQDLIYLVKALTVVERDLQWIGGSVSAGIWVFRNLKGRVPKEAWSVTANWILLNTTNPYLPFGSQNHGAKSLRAYEHLEETHRSKIQSGLQEEVFVAEKGKKERTLRKEQRRISHRKRKGPERQVVIEALQNKSLASRFRVIASDETHTVNFYPSSWAHEADIEFLSSLDESLRHSLARKLKGKQRGPWASFKKRLLRVTGIPWNRSAWFERE